MVCLLLTTGAAPGRALAQRVDLGGRYAIDLQASDDIRAAIEATVRGMNFLRRPIARSRLRGTNPVGNDLRILATPREVRIAFDRSPPLISPPDGSFVVWTREDGEPFQLSTRWDDDAIVQTLVADQGTRSGRFSLSAGGETLTLSVTVTSPQLPRPLEYALVYRRQLE